MSEFDLWNVLVTAMLLGPGVPPQQEYPDAAKAVVQRHVIVAEMGHWEMENWDVGAPVFWLRPRMWQVSSRRPPDLPPIRHCKQMLDLNRHFDQMLEFWQLAQPHRREEFAAVRMQNRVLGDAWHRLMWAYWSSEGTEQQAAKLLEGFYADHPAYRNRAFLLPAIPYWCFRVEEPPTPQWMLPQ